MGDWNKRRGGNCDEIKIKRLIWKRDPILTNDFADFTIK